MTDAPDRKRRVDREHILQCHGIKRFAENAIDMPRTDYLFIGFDMAGQKTQNQRAREATRGIIPGTPDTCLHIAGLPPLWVELKVHPNKASDVQNQTMARLARAGCRVGIAYSVVEYCHLMREWGVLLKPNADFQAQVLDGNVATLIAKAEARAESGGSTRKAKAAPRFTAGKRMVARAAKSGIRL